MSRQRVAVYIDFDNVVISRYDAVHGSGRWHKDGARHHRPSTSGDEVAQRLDEAEVDLGAIIDYASSFGTVALTRAYADWSVPANAAYKQQLVDRAIDLVQLFMTSGTKNGADIRLSIDAVNDLFQHDDITHVVVVAGDSDYIALAQRCKSLGRYVVGIGVTGSTSRALVAACDDFSSYGDLPGVADEQADSDGNGSDGNDAEVTDRGAAPAKPAKKTAKTKAPKRPKTKQEQATALLRRALQIGAEKSDDGWQHSASLKPQMQRLDSTFKEKSLGFSSFRAFLESRDDVVETKQLNGQLSVRLR